MKPVPYISAGTVSARALPPYQSQQGNGVLFNALEAGDVRPCDAISDSVDCSAANSKMLTNLSEGFAGFDFTGNMRNLIGTQFALAVAKPACSAAVILSVAHIRCVGVIAKILNSVVEFIPVNVAHLHFVGARAEKGKRNKFVNTNLSIVDRYAIVAALILHLCQQVRLLAGGVSCANREASHVADVANFIESFESWNGSPLFLLHAQMLRGTPYWRLI